MKYSLKADLTQRKIENELFLFDRSKGAIYGFSETGAIIWECLAAGCDTETIVKRIVDEYDVPHDEAKRDVDEFIAHCHTKGFVALE